MISDAVSCHILYPHWETQFCNTIGLKLPGAMKPLIQAIDGLIMMKKQGLDSEVIEGINYLMDVICALPNTTTVSPEGDTDVLLNSIELHVARFMEANFVKGMQSPNNSSANVERTQTQVSCTQ